MGCAVRSLITALLFLIFILSPTAGFADEEYNLTKEEAALVKRILLQDRLLKEMSRTQQGLEGLNRLLSLTITGPVKIALTWNLTAIKGWRIANDNLARIGKIAICSDLLLQMEESTVNRAFFEKMREARGCNDL